LRVWRVLLVGAIGLATLTLSGRPQFSGLAAEPSPTAVAPPEVEAFPRREVQSDIEPAAISAIDSPSPTCYRPVANTGACYIQWAYLSVSAVSPGYVVSMTVAIDNQIRANYSGFFQTSMYIPGDFHGRGFRVTCGWPSGDGSSGLGNTYSYTIRARETGGATAANSGSVTCPADIVRTYLPLVAQR
jgi:hypothetical protein